MLAPKLLLVIALVIIAFALYLLLKTRQSKTTIKIAKFGELSTTSLGVATLVIGAVLGYFGVVLDQKGEVTAQALRAAERRDLERAAAPTPSISVSQSSTGDGSPNIGVVNGGSMAIQVDKSNGTK